ncbi:MAG: bifunctional phosphopantothenoylcysteine decarboxylase/phosphopantothenate--cysteine ligase CoaBC [Ferruginibacter sp.]
MFKGKKILVGITGSIAAYKAAVLVRSLIKNGAEVKVIMTVAACDFISPLTLSTLSKNEVLTDLFEDNTWANHVILGRWADLMVIAPASCNTIAKMANGHCDNLLQAVYLSATCPVMIAPAMDEDMWKHPSTQTNLKKLESYGNTILPVESGELASGLSGEGRMAEPETITEVLAGFFKKKNDLTGKTVLVSAGPTYEAIDPVRFIGNRSTGKMGIAIANECIDRGAKVILVLGPGAEEPPELAEVTNVESAAEMYAACVAAFPRADIALMCAAVSDYTPVTVSKEKIKKNDAVLVAEFKRTEDILKKLGELKTGKQLLVGFALETENEQANAVKKLKTKNADFIVLNSLRDEGAGFGHNTNKIIIFDKAEKSYPFEMKKKEAVAKDIIDTILNNQHA